MYQNLILLIVNDKEHNCALKKYLSNVYYIVKLEYFSKRCSI